jgi:hypothetical protein
MSNVVNTSMLALQGVTADKIFQAVLYARICDDGTIELLQVSDDGSDVWKPVDVAVRVTDV